MFLITGVNGYIGSKLKEHLGGRRALTLDTSGPSDFVGCISQSEEFLARHSGQIDTVIHMADLRFEQVGSGDLQANIDRHRQFIKACERHLNIENFVFCSSCSVYGFSEEAVDESTPAHPTSNYAQSKLAVENILRNSSLPFTVIRFGTAYGPSRQMRFDLFVNRLVQATVQNEEMDVFDLQSARPYLYTDDFARVLLAAAKVRGQRSITNVIESNLTKDEVIQRVGGVLKKTPRLRLEEDRQEPRHYRVRHGSEQRFGIKISRDFNKGLEDFVHEIF